MEMFNVHRRDIIDFDNYMDLKKPGFGGPSSAKLFRDNSGKRVNKDPRLKEYQRVVERDPMFSHPVYNSTYKAMSHDVVYKQEKKKPYTYPDPYKVGIPVVDITEGKCMGSFEQFITESEYGMNPMGGEKRVPCRNEDKAEDILLDMRIDWDGWDEAPVGRGKSFTKDGDIVAYFDDSVRPHELVILPEAELMPEEEFERVTMGSEREEEEEDEEEIEDEYFKPEREDEEEREEMEFKAPSQSRSVRDIEKMLSDLEQEEEEEDEF